MPTAAAAAMTTVRQLVPLTGMGTPRAGVLVLACCGWWAFRHGTEVGALRGLTPPPEARGTTAAARGSANAGTEHIRAMAIAMAWGWRRVPPERARTQGSQQRFGHGRSRLRRRGRVALARQRLLAWWRGVETGVLPDGAALKAAVTR